MNSEYHTSRQDFLQWCADRGLDPNDTRWSAWLGGAFAAHKRGLVYPTAARCCCCDALRTELAGWDVRPAEDGTYSVLLCPECAPMIPHAAVDSAATANVKGAP